MSRSSLLASIWSSFKKIQGTLITALGLAVAIVAWIFKPDAKVPLEAPLIFGILAVLVIATLADAFVGAMRGRVLLEVVYVAESPGGPLILLLEPSDFFSHNAAVSCYYRDDNNFERLVGLGFVANIQEDGRVQVRMISAAPGQETTLDEIKQSKAAVLRRVIVKPVADIRYLSALQDFEYGR